MDKLSTNIRKLLQRIEILEDYQVEKLIIEHLQQNLNDLDALQQSYQQHYLRIIETLLKHLISISDDQQTEIKKRMAFLEKLLQEPSLTDLETLQQGIALFPPYPDLPATRDEKIIGDTPPVAAEVDPQYQITHKIRTIQQNNDRFVLTLREFLQRIDTLYPGTNLEETRNDLEKQAQLLLQKQRHLAFQLEQTRQQLMKSLARNEQLNVELQCAKALSLTDELTGLPNRRAFLHRAQEEIGRVQRHPAPLTLIIVDIDHFKKINDEYGHSIGDEVLRTYAKEILSSFRRHDYVARFGGEEFILLLPDTDINGAIRALDKIRFQVGERQVMLEVGHITLPTFSAGVALYRTHESIDGLIERADQALYRAKQSGRNRTERAA